MKTLASLLLMAVALHAQSFTPAGSAKIVSDYEAWPVWTGGALVFIEHNLTQAPVIHSFDESGQELLPIAFTIPGARGIQIFGFGRGSDGAFAIAGRTMTADGKALTGFVSWVSPNHQTIQTKEVAPYFPALAAVAPDGTIWTAGTELDSKGTEDPREVDRSHGMLRHFDKNGTQLGAFIPRSEFGVKWPGFSKGVLVAGKDRVGWYQSYLHEYFEMTFDGKITHFKGAAPSLRGLRGEDQVRVYDLALTDDHEVIVQTSQAKKRHQLLRLDRATGTWTPIAAPPGTTKEDAQYPTGPNLYGGDGTRVVFQGMDQPGQHIKFFKLSASPQSSND